ncbi:methionine adenosyltransferase [Anaerocaecibacter muris]|uniref:methionine adenosyltransferase n=1 Tax=Anaerocaecibacter muris TaxID=2941513 RepID=UPI00203CB6FF|nr:methionine adenosyltransferase [Anaerocaecibacter muris]
MNRIISSESVTEGHPDKVCDYIADAILDAALEKDENSRIACEVCCATGLAVVLGEFDTQTDFIDVQKIARATIAEVGYTDPALGFDARTCAVLNCINGQSPDISRGVLSSLESRSGETSSEYDRTGAGDQGMMFGYACSETDELMPMPITLSHALTKRLAEVRKSGELDFLRPDGKAMVSLAYENGVPVGVKTVVVSAQHAPDATEKQIRDGIIDCVVKRVIPDKLLRGADILINPTGRFVVGGPAGDTGVTGRKIIVDTYGGAIPHGGGAFSGKDASKVDRSASYYARYVCKNVVAAGLADKALLQVGYAIGKARPVSLYIDTFGTGDDKKILDAVQKVFDFRPAAISDKLGLKKPIYKRTTNYGHFGKADLPWEQVDSADKLKSVM